MSAFAKSQNDLTFADFNAAAAGVGGRVMALIMGLSFLFVLALLDLRFGKIFSFPLSVSDASQEDMMAFWRGAKLALQGQAEAAFDVDAFRTDLPETGAGLLWLNPPHFFLMVAPFGLLPYGAAKALWMALSLMAMATIARIASPKSIFALLILFSPAAFAHLLVIQAGPFVALALLGALLLTRDRPITAGLLLALLTVKPQFGLFVPVYLAACGHWRAIGWTIAATGGLVVLSIAVFGLAPWQAFLATAIESYGGHSDRIHRDMVTIQQSVGKLGGGDMLRSFAQIATITIGAIAVWIAARRWKRDDAIGLTLLVSAFASPSLWIYDWPLVVAGLFMLARNQKKWPLLLQCLAGALWIAPLVSLGITTMESSLFAPVIFALTIGGFMIWKSRGGAPADQLSDWSRSDIN